MPVSELLPHNMYENMVLSSLKNWKGQRIEKYNYVPNLQHNELSALKQLHPKWFKGSAKSNYKVPDYQCSDFFEADLYFKAENPIQSLEYFLGGCVDTNHFYKFTSIIEEESIDDWVFIEMTPTRSIFAAFKDLDKNLQTMKKDLAIIKQDLAIIKQDLAIIKQDLKTMTSKLDMVLEILRQKR